MGSFSGIVLVAGLPRDNAEVRLYPSASFGSPPVKDTPFPATGLLQTVTSGPAHGGTGAYRFLGVTAGAYYAGADWLGTIIWDSHDVQSDTNAANVKSYGAVGDGLTDDTAAFQTALNDAAIGELLIGPGDYSVGNITLTNRSNFRVRGTGGRILWDGTAAAGNQIGFQLVGTCTNIELDGVRVNGDSVPGNKHCLLWCADGQTLTDIRVRNCYVTNCVRGVRLSASSSGTTKGLVIEDNHFLDTVGTSSGQGEAVFIDEGSLAPAGIRICGNYFENSRRYDIHVNQAIGVVVKGNVSRDHRLTGNSGAQVPCFRFIRVQDVIIAENIFEKYFDGGIEVTAITGTVTRNVKVTNNQFINSQNALTDISIGNTSPAADGAVEEITVIGNTVYKSAINQDMIRVNSGLFVEILENLLVNLGVTATVNGIDLQGSGDSGGTATYNDLIMVAGNIIRGSNGGGGAFRGIALETAFCTSIATCVFWNNVFSVAPAFATGANITNPNLYISNQPRMGATFAAAKGFGTLSCGGLDLGGAFQTPVRNVTTTATLNAYDQFVTADGSGGAFTINLPAASTAPGRRYSIVRTSAAGNITIDPSGAETINGAATKRIDTQYGALDIECDGSAWWIVSSLGTIT